MSRYRIVVYWGLTPSREVRPYCGFLKFGSFPEAWDSWANTNPNYSEIHRVAEKFPKAWFEEIPCHGQKGVQIYTSVLEGSGGFFAENIHEQIEYSTKNNKQIYAHLDNAGKIVTVSTSSTKKADCKVSLHVMVGLLVAGHPVSKTPKWVASANMVTILGDTVVMTGNTHRGSGEHVKTKPVIYSE